MTDIYGNLLRADKVKPGQRLEYFDPEGKPAVVTVATADRLPSCNPKFPDQMHLQIDHPDLNRIAWGISTCDYVQIIEQERVIIPALFKKPFVEEPKIFTGLKAKKKLQLGSSLIGKKKGLKARKKKG